MKNLICLIGLLLFVLTTYAQNCNLNEDAQRNFARANAAIKVAKTNEDYLKAVEEFKKVLEFAPACADIYYNIAVCYEKSAGTDFFRGNKEYSEALEYYKKYLELNPNAPDKQKVQNKIIEMEYNYEHINPAEPEMLFVRGGTFWMGSTEEQGLHGIYSYGKHQVTLSSYYIGKYEVTQQQWKTIMGDNPSKFKGDNLPIDNVSWDEVQIFITRLNVATGKQYRLPTEAEWEFAARGGNKSKGYKYSGSNIVDDIAWYKKNSDKKTHVVGTKLPNELGIYDMSGNVIEWCNDRFSVYDNSQQTNPQGPLSGSDFWSGRVSRGGGWHDGDGDMRVAIRNGWYPGKGFTNKKYFGFRLAHSIN